MAKSFYNKGRGIRPLIFALLCPIILFGQVTVESINYVVDPGFEDGTAFETVEKQFLFFSGLRRSEKKLT
jgi:hypothetical protein